jgi:putative CocE/NonD family hydrolase
MAKPLQKIMRYVGQHGIVWPRDIEAIGLPREYLVRLQRQGLLRAREGENDARTHLLLGPWVHGVDSTGKTRSGGREFGPAAAIDYEEVVLRWMDHYLKGTGNGVDRERPVCYFVIGRNQWRDADQWPPAARAMPAFLAPQTSGTSLGRLQTAPFDNDNKDQLQRVCI